MSSNSRVGLIRVMLRPPERAGSRAIVVLLWTSEHCQRILRCPRLSARADRTSSRSLVGWSLVGWSLVGWSLVGWSLVGLRLRGALGGQPGQLDPRADAELPEHVPQVECHGVQAEEHPARPL